MCQVAFSATGIKSRERWSCESNTEAPVFVTAADEVRKAAWGGRGAVKTERCSSMSSAGG